MSGRIGVFNSTHQFCNTKALSTPDHTQENNLVLFGLPSIARNTPVSKTNLSHSSALKGKTSIHWEQKPSPYRNPRRRQKAAREDPSDRVLRSPRWHHFTCVSAGQGRAGSPPRREQRAPGCRETSAKRGPPAPNLPRPVPPSCGSQRLRGQYLRGEAPPCGAAPAAPGRAAASYCDHSPRRRPARQGRRPRASSPPEPRFRLRRCHGASFLLAPSHGPRQETTAPRPALKESASASEAPSFPPSVPTARASGGPPASRTRGPAPLHPASALADRHRPRRRSGLRCARRRYPRR